MYNVILILDKFFLKYEGGSNWPPPQEKLPSKSPALLGLKHFLEVVTNGFFIGFPHSFNIRILILSWRWALLGSNLLKFIEVVVQQNLIDVKTRKMAIIDRGRALSCKIWIKKLTFCLNFRCKFVIMIYWWYKSIFYYSVIF